MLVPRKGTSALSMKLGKMQILKLRLRLRELETLEGALSNVVLRNPLSHFDVCSSLRTTALE